VISKSPPEQANDQVEASREWYIEGVDHGLGWPQLDPTLTDISVFRWDINIRESTAASLVGAGGISVVKRVH